MLPEAIVFDFDGVIADTEPVHLLAFQEELAAIGLPLSHEDYLARYLGYTDREGFAAVARDRGRSLATGDIDRLIARKTVRVQELLSRDPLTFPGVADRVREWMPRIPMAIASGALRAEIATVLAQAGLGDCFSVVVSADDPVESKPSPAPYLAAMDRLGATLGRVLDPRRCVAIEDSRWGITAARAAGMRVIGVTTSYAAEGLTDAHLVVPGVAALETRDLAALVADTRD